MANKGNEGKVELLLPVGNIECLRAAVANGADAVYLGMSRFNARIGAGNFDEENIFSSIQYCHERNVKVYIAFNTLVKDREIPEFFRLMSIAYQAKADAVIIQDSCFIPIIRKNFPGLKIHLSTQATVTNSYSIPGDKEDSKSKAESVDRVILARELTIDEITSISKKHDTEVFVHGALCFSYSGQCLFSSMVGGRSGNRGMCAQPCRKMYNNKYLLSTMDLCLLPKLPELIKSGVKSLKVEGRMRSALYVATVARIYRKYIDLYYAGKFSSEKQISQDDMDELKLVFNREFTEGFAFKDTIIDSRKPMNRGLNLGFFLNGKIKLKHKLSIGDGMGIWKGKTADEVVGYVVESIIKDGNPVKHAAPGDIVEIDTKGAKDHDPVYITSEADMKLDLGDELFIEEPIIRQQKIELPELKKVKNEDPIRLFVKIYRKSSAIIAEKSGADIIYYDILKDDCADVKNALKTTRFFVYTPRIVSDKETEAIAKKIESIKPAGVLVGNKGFLKFLENKGYELHLDYSFNCFNDIDLDYYSSKKLLPVISPELNLNELSELNDKRFIAYVHGDLVLMTTKEKINAPELVDDADRHFKVREYNSKFEILNANPLALADKSVQLLKHGIRYFYLDAPKDAENIIKTYMKILNYEKIDDKLLKKLTKGSTTGHFARGVL